MDVVHNSGQWRVFLIAASVACISVEVTFGQPQPAQGGAIAGIVVHDISGVPISGVTVRLGVPPTSVDTDAAGRFLVSSLPPGTHEISISIVGFTLARRSVVVVAGETTEVQIRLAEGAGTYNEAVVVRADSIGRPESGVPAQDVLRGAALQNLRGVMIDDPLRAVQTLPGVSATDDLHSVFAVRGSAPSHLGFVVDGIPTRFLLHTVEVVDGSGSTSMIGGDVIESATLLAGSYPQRHGNRTGAQLEFDLREGSRDRHAARVSVSGSSMSLIAEGPLVSPGKGSWLVAVRRSYLDWLIDQIFEDPPSFAFGFADAQAKGVYDVGARHRVELTMAAGRATFEDTPDEVGINGVQQGRTHNWLAGLRWRFTPTSTTVITQQVFSTGGGYRNDNENAVELDRGDASDLGYRTTISYAPRDPLHLELGAQLIQGTESKVSRRLRGTPAALQVEQQYRGSGLGVGAYAQLRWSPHPRVSLSPGIRVDRAATVTGLTGSPWLQSEWRPSDSWRVTAGTGLYRQAPRFEHLRGRRGNPALASERAWHVDLGIEQTLPLGLRWRVTGYRREEYAGWRATNVEWRRVGNTLFGPSATTPFTNRLTGHASGVEFLIGREQPNGLTGWVAYSVGETRYRDESTGEQFVGDYDAPHTLNIYGSWRVSNRTNLSARLRTASNFPQVGYFAETGTTDVFALTNERNQVRLPGYSRLDVRLNQTFSWARRRLTLFAEVSNLLNHDNWRAIGGSVNVRTGAVTGIRETLLPFLPSAGVLLEF